MTGNSYRKDVAALQMDGSYLVCFKKKKRL
jgi:hypothetical protein